MPDYFAHASAGEWGSISVDMGLGLVTGEGGAARTVVQMGSRLSRRLLGRLTIASGRLIGNPRAIVAGIGKLSKSQERILSQLPKYGSRVIVPKRRVRTNDLAALTAHTGDEFAMFSTGGRRMIIRGDSRSVPIGVEDAQVLAGQGWRWSAHTHPGLGWGVLRSSEGDRAILKVFANQRSAIFNSQGTRSLFNHNGDLLTNWKPF